MYQYKSKAQTLKFLEKRTNIFKVPKLIVFKISDFKASPREMIENIITVFNCSYLAVRSSSLQEDCASSSAAGKFDSVLKVESTNYDKLSTAINKVIKSYGFESSSDDEVIVQEMVEDSDMSGVVFTHDLNTGAPYYVINYDDTSGQTDTVTSGSGEYSNRTIYIHRNSMQDLRSERFVKLLQAIKELERVMGSQFLDIEFALGKDLILYLLQVREITTQPNWNRAISKRIDDTLQGARVFAIERFKKLNGVYGETTLLGQMPDWNPIEMIGRAPRALATSLYQILITDHAWSDARRIMGYAVPEGQPLMVTLAGQPFIDTRLSFHSYLPNTISPTIGEKAVNHWLKKLKTSPELHDKVEFEIAITAFSFDIDDKIELLIGNALTSGEKNKFKQAHLEQTRSLIKGGNGSLKKALGKIKILKSKQSKQNSSELSSNISDLFTMVSDCIQYGTIPFSILARHGFIAKTLLFSLQHLGIISKVEVNQIQATIQTVASDLVDDMRSLQLGKMSNSEFMIHYGHLRPGTYDIRSLRYDQMGDISNGATPIQQADEIEKFQLSKEQEKQIDALLIDNNFGDFKAEDIFSYIREATIAREYGKFIFTRSISDMLELIANFSEKNGLSRSEISHVPLDSILKTVKSSNISSIEKYLRDISELEQEKHQVSVAIRLPQLLTDQAGVYIVPFQVSHPNFVTHKKVTAQCLVLHSETDKLSLKGRVIIIEGADPGFDWIFSQEIAGLITKYGGVNSHMTIRCAEFGIPAAIGCGEQRYESLLKSNKVHLDCAAGLISLLH